MQIHFFSDNALMNISAGISFVLFLFLGFLFVIFMISLFKKEKILKLKKYPQASVIIPVYNEEQNIINCLESLIRSDYGLKLLEIIVVDDGSNDNTKSLVEDFIRAHKDADVKLVPGKHRGKSMALNLGLKKSKNEIIVAIDADVTLRKDTIRNLVAPITRENVGATNAVAVINNPKNLIEHFQHIEFCLNNLTRTSFSRVYGNSVWFFGAVACYRKSALKEIGYFKTRSMTEDMDICLELYRKNYEIVTVEKASIYTNPMKNIGELFKQRMRWYFGALQALIKNKGLLKTGKKSVPVLFLFFNQFWWTFFAFVFFPMTAYQVYYWFPQGTAEAISYLARWFSVAGPFYVLYKIPDWGLNLLNIFGVLSGIITLIMSFAALARSRAKVSIKTIICLAIYFPYTIIQDAIVVVGVLKHGLSRKKKYFIK